MEIKKISIHNIASIEDAEIDFTIEPLVSSDVFLISGKTGSGKSTILDAICLALYGTTPRLENLEEKNAKINDGDIEITARDPRQLMRRGTGDCAVCLLFCGNDGTEYESLWTVSRAGKKSTGRLQSKKWMLRNLKTGTLWDKDKEIETEIKKATGLTYDQFCRTTMLAQGDFLRFLNSKDDEKSEILEKITGTGIYAEIGRRIYEFTSDKKTEYDIAQNLAGGVTLLPEEQKEQKQQRISELSSLKTQLEEQGKILQSKQQWISENNKIAQQIDDAEKMLNQARLLTENDDFRKQKAFVNEWKNTIDARQQLKQFNLATLTIKEQEQKRHVLDERYNKSVAGLLWKQNELNKLTDAHTNAVKNHDSLEEKLTAKQKELTNKEKELERLDMPSVRKRQKENSDAISLVEVAKTHLRSYNEEKARQDNERNELDKLKKDIDKRLADLTSLKEKAENCKKESNEKKQTLDKMAESMDDWAKVARSKIKKGDKCPVCQQVVNHELHVEDELQILLDHANKEFNDAEQKYKEAEKEFDTKRTEAETLNNDLSRRQKALENSLPALSEKLETLKKDLLKLDIKSQQANEIEEHLHTLESGFNTLKNKIAEEIDAGEKLEKEVGEIRKQKDGLIKERDQTKEKVNEAKEAKNKCQNDISTAKQVLTSLPFSESRLQNALIGVVAEPQPLANVNDLLATAAAIESREKEASAQKESASAWLQDFHKAHPDITLQHLTELSQYSLEKVETINAEIEKHEKAVTENEAVLNEHQKRRKEHEEKRPNLNDDDLDGTLQLRIDENLKQITGYSTEQGTISAELKADDDNRQRLATLIADAENKQRIYNRWKDLCDIFGDRNGKTLRTIAQSYVLSNLIHSANHYMNQLSDRYELKVEPGSFAIEVIDAYQGYTSRSSATISGGEGFLVSLALALALSDIGKGLSANILFIDEGFGTLSGEPLQNAVNTLKSLHSQTGRHVGIISHIEELQERLPVQIQVLQEGHNSHSSVVIPQTS